MLIECIKFAVFATCLAISVSLIVYLDWLIANGEEWGDTEGFIIISPLILVTFLFGFFLENIKRVNSYSLIVSFLLTIVIFVESFYVDYSLPPNPDFVDLAYFYPFPYLFVIFGLFFLVFFSLLTLGFALGFIKRKIYR